MNGEVRAGRVRGLLVFVVSASVLAAAALVPQVAQAPVVCLWRRVTSLPCPSCGMTRAFVALAHGHWDQAVAFNAAAPLIYFTVWVIAGLALAETCLARDLLARTWRASRRYVIVAILPLMATAWILGLVRRFPI
jgi:hypothetical protein